MNLTVGIVCVLTCGNKISGTGFVVSSDGLIATCSHVVQREELQKRGAPKPEQLTVVFLVNGERREAKLEAAWWRAYDAGDVAILRLKGELPAGVQSLPLGSSAGTTGHTVRTFGFPALGKVDGLPGKGEVIGATTESGQPVLTLQSSDITSGFSGAPAWDEARRRVIGMVNSVAKPDLLGRLTQTDLVTPADTLQAVCPLLQLSDVCPYRSLDTFTEHDAEFFKGRQRLTARLLDSLRREPRFLAVLGPSGSGKSSLVQAGLISQLRQGAMPGSDRWGILITRPTDQPFDRLTEQGLVGASESLTQAVKTWMDQHSESTRLVLVIDQFEELLVSCAALQRQAFIAKLTMFLQAPLSITVVLTMRDDFYSHFALQAPGLVEWLERGLINVPPTLERTELTAMIEEPARAVGMILEEGLAARIIQDAFESPSTAEVGVVARSTILPLLEFALKELWERRLDGMLTHDAYTAIGGVTGGLTQWADRAFYNLEESLRPHTRRILTDLVRMGDESEGIPDSRRRRSVADLCRQAEEWENVQRVVQCLANARLVVSGQEVVDIIHDALIREWGLLRQWLREDRRFLMWHQELERHVRAWVVTSPDDPEKRDADKLLRGRDLAEAEGWLSSRGAELSRIESEYLRASIDQREAAEAERRRQLEEERRLRLKAEEQQRIAESREFATRALLSMEDDPAEALLHAIQSGRRAPTQEAEVVLRKAIQASHARAIFRHDAAVYHAIFSPDAVLVVTASADGTVGIWERDTGRLLHRLRGHENDPHHCEVFRVAFSPEAKTLASAGKGGVIRLWDVASGAELRPLGRHVGPIMHIEFSRDGKRLLSTSADCTVRLWDVERGEECKCFGGHMGTVWHAAFSPNDRLIVATAGDSFASLIWDLESGKNIASLSTGGRVVWNVFSPDGKRVVTASLKDGAKVWNVENLPEVPDPIVLPGHVGDVHHVSIKQFNFKTKLITAGEDGTARIWLHESDPHGERWHEISTLRGHHKAVLHTAFDTYKAVTASDDGTVGVWEETPSDIMRTESWSKLVVLHGHKGSIGSACLTPDGRFVLTASNDSTARLWSAEHGCEVALFKEREHDTDHVTFNRDATKILVTTRGFLHYESQVIDVETQTRIARLKRQDTDWSNPGPSLNSAVFSTDGSRLVTTYRFWKDAKVWDAKSGTELAVLSGHEGNVDSASFSSDGEWVITSSEDKTVRIWDAASGHELALLNGYEEGVMVLSSAKHRVLTYTGNQTVRIWEAPSWQPKTIHLQGGDSQLTCLGFSPVGDTIVTRSLDGEVCLWSVDSCGKLAALCGHTERVDQVCFSADGRKIVTVSIDGIALVWDAIPSAESVVLKGEHTGVTSAAISHDGLKVLTCCSDGHIRVWNMSGGGLLATLPRQSDKIRSADFSLDGKKVVTISQDRTVRVFLVNLADLLELAQSRLPKTSRVA